MPTSRFDHELRYVPAIPLPFWYRGWRSLWRWRPSCYQCKLIFKTEKEFDAHYVLHHLEGACEDG